MTLTSTTVTLASDRQRTIATLTLAFCRDPLTRYMFPEAAAYMAHFPELADLLGGRAFDYGTAYCSEGYGGAALWLPPGIDPDTERFPGLLQHVSEERREAMFGLVMAIDGYRPKQPHWYLPAIGVDPAMQGKGHGSALLKHALDECDRAGETAYLETANPATLPLYERHGFEVMAHLRSSDAAPAMWPMLRRPR